MVGTIRTWKRKGESAKIVFEIKDLTVATFEAEQGGRKLLAKATDDYATTRICDGLEERCVNMVVRHYRHFDRAVL